MDLNEVWFWLFTAIVAGYLILDGVDMGVGMLHLVVAKSDTERRIVLNSIGPVWDGNGVWLILAGGVLFAAFPLVYASLLSGFYLVFFLVLVVLILRTVSIEFRSKRASPRWRQHWDVVFSISSLGLALLLGISFGVILTGVPLDGQGNINASVSDVLSPFTLLVGVTAAVMLTIHGAIYLLMKTGGEIHLRLRNIVPSLLIAFVGLSTVTAVTTDITRDVIRESYADHKWAVVVPFAALATSLVMWRMLQTRRDFWAFVASSATIALLLLAGAIGLYPNLLISTINQDYDLTIDNAASASNTLKIMLVFALIGIPLVLLYTAGIYYFFRGKTVLEPDSY